MKSNGILYIDNNDKIYYNLNRYLFMARLYDYINNSAITGGILMKKTILFLLVLSCALALFGCSSKGKGDNKPIPEPEIKVLTKTDDIRMDIYLDGTYSMAGYVNYPSSTVYVNAIKEIERTVSSTWRNETIQYIRFGDDFQKLSREQFLGFDKTAFYNQKDTSLQKVVDSMDDNNVSIIVTDLFQTDQDIESLMSSLKKKSFADKSKALAIVGVKSQFNGRIYDIGKNKIAFDYKTTNDNDSYRPFYFLVTGREDDVRTLVLQYQKNFGENEIRSVIFSRNLGVNNLLSQDANTISGNDKEAIMAKINTIVKNKQVMQFRLNMDKAKSKVNLRMKSEALIGKQPDEYKLVVESLGKWDNNSFQQMDNKGFCDAEIKNFEKRDDKADLTMTLRLNPSGIKKREGKYKANLGIIPSKQDYLKSLAVFDDWSFLDSDVNNENIREFGNKTLNISAFMKMLGNLNYEINKPGFYNLPIYFDAKK